MEKRQVVLGWLWRILSFPARLLLSIGLLFFEHFIWVMAVLVRNLTTSPLLNLLLAMVTFPLFLPFVVLSGFFFLFRACVGWVDVKLGLETPLEAAEHSFTWPNALVRYLARYIYGVEILGGMGGWPVVLRDARTQQTVFFIPAWQKEPPPPEPPAKPKVAPASKSIQDLHDRFMGDVMAAAELRTRLKWSLNIRDLVRGDNLLERAGSVVLIPVTWLFTVLTLLWQRVLMTWHLHRVLTHLLRLYIWKSVRSRGRAKNTWASRREAVNDLMLFLFPKAGLASIAGMLLLLLANIWGPLLVELASQADILAVTGWWLDIGYWVVLIFGCFTFGFGLTYSGLALGEHGERVDLTTADITASGEELFEALGAEYPHMPGLRAVLVVLIVYGCFGLALTFGTRAPTYFS